MAIELEEFKNLMRVDGNDDDTLMQMYLDTAKGYIYGAIGAEDGFYSLETVDKIFTTAVYALAGSYYTYRISISDTTIAPVDATMNSIIGQLRGRYDLWKEGGLDEKD